MSEQETKPIEQEEEKVSTSQTQQLTSMSEEQKNKTMQSSLKSIIDQMEPRARTVEERRNIDRLKHMLPLYDTHSFWDT